MPRLPRSRDGTGPRVAGLCASCTDLERTFYVGAVSCERGVGGNGGFEQSIVPAQPTTRYRLAATAQQPARLEVDAVLVGLVLH